MGYDNMSTVEPEKNMLRHERVKSIMRRKGISSVRQLAAKSGVAYDALVKFTQGKVQFPRGIEKIANALGTTKGYILFGETDGRR